MTIHSLQRPETTPELIEWLERHLVGDTLSELVAELRAVAGRNQTDPPLEQLIGNPNSLLTQGLRPLTADQLRSLLRHPKRLLELQEMIFVDGGDYWEQVPRPPKLVEDSQRLMEVLHKSIDAQSAPSRTSVKQAVSRRSLVTWVVSLAALIVVGLVTSWLMPLGNTSEIAWTAETFRPTASRQEFFKRLVIAPERWLKQNSTTPEQLETNLSRFRQGCDELTLHVNGIPEQDRGWLVEACQKWSKRLDELITQAKDLSNPNPARSFDQIRAEANGLFQKLITRIETESKA